MTSRDTGLLVPLYEHPDDRPEAWRAVLAAASRLYGVVVNPASGPGEAPDASFVAVADELRAAGVRVLGYTDTAYGRRPHADVVRDLLRHRDWYGADGAFLDQTASGPDLVAHYRRLAVAARAAGALTLVLNPGVRPDPAYGEFADLVVTFEGTWDTYRRLDLPLSPRDCHLVHSAPAHATSAAPVHCVVPGSGAHPWGTLPHGLPAA